MGLDVSQKSTAIYVVNERGQRQWRGTCASDPHVLASQLKRHAGADARIGIETGAMTPWLVHGLRQAGLNVDCLDARRVKAALQMRLNKTDQNDAEGLAQVMRTGWYRPVHVKSLDAHRARSLLGARAQLVGMRTRLINMIRGILKTYGMLPGSGRGLRFDRRVEELIQGDQEVGMVVRPLLATLRHVGEQITTFDKAVLRQVRADPTCRLLMSVPGIGALSSLVYVSTVEDPKRFSRSRAVGAHLGLTPRRYQSGDIDRSGRISRCGDSLARTLMYEAAIVILHRVKRASQLSEWAQAIAQRAGPGKARVALARKLSVILHSIWRSGEAFRWSTAKRSA
ncbi:IS110 family transposase [Sphingobium sp. BHU LFT2]|uniref:IS110 family transposase n=1 Tax=Sphingobium sp. BHU LFT2 TaxID=2807634 RepID=UPI001BE78004|nr:IS110 family transposase [Sphingobium sp. BHU LFT2]